MNIREYKAQMAARAAMLERGALSQNPASNDEAKRDKRPSERLSPEQIERAAKALRDHECQHIPRVIEWGNLNEKIKQHFRGKVRVVVDAVGEA